MEISEESIKLARSRYPGLTFVTKNGVTEIEGKFEFCAYFDHQHRQYVINPTDNSPRIIHDYYQIKIEAPHDTIFPKVYETGGRIKRIKDRHINPSNGSFCMVGTFDQIKEFVLEDFLDGPVLQFLHDQSYYERFGEWPRGEYSHETLGLIESYYDRMNDVPKINERCISILVESSDFEKYRQVLVDKGQIKSHHLCICGSGKIYRKCSHMKVFYGLWNLQKFINKLRKERNANKEDQQKSGDSSLKSIER